ncbi:hypothetical protein JCM3774_006125 [Rhodotorula dairenensis]
MASYGLSVLPSLAESSPNMAVDPYPSMRATSAPPSPLYGPHALGSYFAMPTAAIYSPAGGSGTRRESNASSSSSESTSGSGSDDDSSASATVRPSHMIRALSHGSGSTYHQPGRSNAGSSFPPPSPSSSGSAVSARGISALAASASSASVVAEETEDDVPIHPLPMHLPRPKTKQDRERERALGRGPAQVGVKREALGTRLARKRADSLKWAKYASVGTFQVELGLSNDELRRG